MVSCIKDFIGLNIDIAIVADRVNFSKDLNLLK